MDYITLVRKAIIAVIAIQLNLAGASAAEALSGYFIAEARCEAFQSKNKKTNPGNVSIEVGRAYPMIAINKPGGDYFQIVIAGAPVVESRWVHVSCGVHAVKADTPTSSGDEDGAPPTDAVTAESEDNLLALSWQPAFCETKPGKMECELLNDGGLPDAEARLSLHGLWPQPRGKDYCGVPPALRELDRAGRWSELPELDLDAETREALAAVMPGTMSHLQRHEWVKHGTCFGAAGGADEFFDDTLLLVDAINGSSIGRFLADHVGGEVQTAHIRALFDLEFGGGAGDRVQFHCAGDQGRVLLQELKLNLKGRIEDTTEVGSLLLAAEPLSIGCPKGIIDPAGLQ